MHEASDAELVELTRADDTEAFRLLLERYYTLAFAIALHFVPQPETAQDLVQEAMLQAYLSLDRLRDATRFKSWFYGIVLNVCRHWRLRFGPTLLSRSRMQYWAVGVLTFQMPGTKRSNSVSTRG